MTLPSCQDCVLIVEDDLDVRESILEVLAENDFRAISASNGREGLETLRAGRGRPCVILLDVMMPVLDGHGFRAEQRRDPDLSSIPVVVLTAHASAEQTSREMQADGYLRKPVKLEALIKTIERYCTRTRA